MRNSSPSFDVSVVVVSDFETADEKTWSDEREVLGALSEQDIATSFPIVLVESADTQDSMPADVAESFPRTETVFCDETRSAPMKDLGVAHTDTEFVAVIEADCIPEPSWLRRLLEALQDNREYAVASGRTVYGRETMYRRCLTVLDRGFDQLGRAGETTHISNNGAVYRRDVLSRYPYPKAATPFLSSRQRRREMQDDGHRFFYEPSAVTRHAIGGWDFLCDFRRNTGFADARERNTETVSDLVRQLWERRRQELQDCFRVGRNYLRWYDWPLLASLFVLAPFLESLGAVDVINGRDGVPGSAYR